MAAFSSPTTAAGAWTAEPAATDAAFAGAGAGAGAGVELLLGPGRPRGPQHARQRRA